MWKRSVIALMVACSLVGCKGGAGLDEAVGMIKTITNLIKLGSSSDSSSDSSSNHEKSTLLQLPAPTGLRLTPPNYAPDILNATAYTYRSPIKYTPTSTPTVYFDERGKLALNRVANGYSRQFLGKTRDGRVVAQDFYDNGVPQTAPFIFRANADVNSFDANMTDGLLLNFAKDGSLESVSEWANGKILGVQSIYRQQKLFAQLLPEENDVTIWLLYPTGIVKSQLKANQKTQHLEILVFREDGSASMLWKQAENSLAMWRPDGRSVTEQDDDFKTMLQQNQQLTQNVLNEIKTLETLK